MSTRHRTKTRTLSQKLSNLWMVTLLILGTAAVMAVTATSASAASQGQAIVDVAASQAGEPYCMAGGNTSGPTHGTGGPGCGGSTMGFDCSGLALYVVFQATGVTLPHGHGMESVAGGKSIAKADLLPGDLVFFGGGSLSNFEHVGVYAGAGMMWDANDYNTPVQQHSLTWEEHALPFVGAVRYWKASSGGGSSAYADGAVIRASDTGRIYIMAGGAPMYVSSWNNVGGSKSVNVSLTQTQVNALPDYPRDGSVVRSGTTGRIYIMAGGAPMYVSSWNNVGGSKSLTTIDQWAITNQLRQFPQDGTYIRGYTSGSIYVTAGGAPMYISSWSAIGGSHSVVSVDQSAISSLPDYPEDGTYLRNFTTGGIYIVAGGAPLYVTSSANAPAGRPINVDEWVFSHQLRDYPVNGTYIKNYSTGVGYVIAGGAPMGITSWSAVGGPFPYTYVDGWAITNQLLQYPADGTFVRGYTSKRIYSVQSQQAVYISDPAQVTDAPVNVDDWAIDNQLHPTN